MMSRYWYIHNSYVPKTKHNKVFFWWLHNFFYIVLIFEIKILNKCKTGKKLWWLYFFFFKWHLNFRFIKRETDLRCQLCFSSSSYVLTIYICFYNYICKLNAMCLCSTYWCMFQRKVICTWMYLLVYTIILHTSKER